MWIMMHGTTSLKFYLYPSLSGIQTVRTIRSSIVAIPTMLWAGWLWLLIPVGAKDFPLLQNVQTSSRAHPTFCWMGNGVLSQGWRGRGVKLTPHLYLVPRLRMRGALLLLPLCVFIAWTMEILPLLLHYNKRIFWVAQVSVTLRSKWAAV